MKKFLFALILLGTTAVLAQGLFPELAHFDGREKKISNEDTTQVISVKEMVAEDETIENLPAAIRELLPQDEEEVEVSVKDDEISNEGIAAEVAVEEDLFAQKQPEQEDVNVGFSENVAEQEETEDEEEPKIVIYMAKVDSTTPPNYNFAYCFGTLGYVNELRRPVQILEFDLTYGAYTRSFSVRNLKKGVEQSSDKFALMGTSCNVIANMPQINIKRCVIEDMEEEKCKKRVVFEPIRE